MAALRAAIVRSFIDNPAHQNVVPVPKETEGEPEAAAPGPPDTRPGRYVQRAWRRVAADGSDCELLADKQAVATRCSIPLRDLRLMDAELYPTRVLLHTLQGCSSPHQALRRFSTALLSRAHAIVFNVEGIRMIVTHEEALVPNAEMEEASLFASSLARRLRSGADATSSSSGDAPSAVSSSSASSAPRRVPLVRQESWRTAASLPAPPHVHSRFSLASLAPLPPLAGLPTMPAPPPAPPPLSSAPPSSASSGVAGTAARAAAGNSGGGGAPAPPSHSQQWLRVSSTGATRHVSADKHTVAARFAVPLRDLRVLDGGLTTSFSAALLSRERTIVVNLEGVRCLLTHREALLPPGLDATPVGAAFVAELHRRLATAPATLDPVQLDSPLPFEFRVLDAALEAACGALEASTAELERDVPPALDALGASIDGVRLERVRRLKGLISRRRGAAAAVRAEIQAFLDDDSDMRGMYLTRKAEERRAAREAGGGGGGGGGGGFGSSSNRGGAFSPGGYGMTSPAPASGFPRGGGGGGNSSFWSGGQKKGYGGRSGRRAGGFGGTYSGFASGFDSGIATPTGGPTPFVGRAAQQQQQHSQTQSHSQSAPQMQPSSAPPSSPMSAAMPSYGEGLQPQLEEGEAPPTTPLASADFDGGGSSFRGGRDREQLMRRESFGASGSGAGGGGGGSGAFGASFGVGVSFARAESRHSHDGSEAVAASLARALEKLDEDADVQALEDILETYFAQLDRTCARLDGLDELVAQTEAYVNIDLDSKRNALIEMMLVTAYCGVVTLAYTTITGLFAMNITNYVLDTGAPGDIPQFQLLNGLFTVFIVLSSMLFVAVLRRRRILNFV